MNKVMKNVPHNGTRDRHCVEIRATCNHHKEKGVCDRAERSAEHDRRSQAKVTERPFPRPTVDVRSSSGCRVGYDQLVEARDYILSRTSVRPEFGVICGSGLGGLAEQLDAQPAPCVVSYTDIPHFPAVSGLWID